MTTPYTCTVHSTLGSLTKELNEIIAKNPNAHRLEFCNSEHERRSIRLNICTVRNRKGDNVTRVRLAKL